jgi:hypothetical protein
MDVTPLFIVFLPVITVLAVGILGTTRRLGFWPSVILSILLTPLGGFLIALISGPKRKKPKPVKAIMREVP